MGEVNWDALPDEGAYIIRFDDAEREDEFFAGHGAKDAARRRYEMVSVSWNAHLYVKFDSNCRDCVVPNARATADAEDAARYRWLKENKLIRAWPMTALFKGRTRILADFTGSHSYVIDGSINDIDAAIDSAMSAAGRDGEGK